MKTFKFLLCFFAATAIIFACQKEKSHESGNSTVSDGSLQSAAGVCLGSTVGGNYQKDTNLNSSNYVDVQVLVNVPGSYLVYTDTVNGMWFRSSGNFSTAGVQTVRLPGFGKPILIGTNTFNVYYDSTQCTFDVTTVAGSSAAVYSLSGSGSTCINASFQGTYTQGVATNASNTMTVEVNVTALGTYSITSTAGGITFNKSGTFTTLGTQSVILTASGTPTAAGTVTFPVVAGSSTCSKDLVIGSSSGAAVYTLVGAPSACSGAFAVAGTYTQGTALTASNTVTVQVNVTTVGTYSLTTNAQNGITFSASGTFTAGQTGLQTVVMTATGQIPTNSGAFTYTVTGASTSCTFSITYAAALNDYYPTTTNSNWSYNTTDNSTSPATLDTLLRKVISSTLNANGNTYNIFMETNNSAGTPPFDSSGYFRKNISKDYFQWLDVGSFFSLDNPVWGEYIFLKDYVPASTSWFSAAFSGTVGGAPVQVRYQETIMQKDVPITVLTQTYQNTIVVRENYQYSLDGGTTWTAFQEYTMNYFSRNIGLIKLEFFDASGASSYKMEITRNQIF